MQDELLKGEVFDNLRDAQILIERMEEASQSKKTTHCIGLSPEISMPMTSKAYVALTINLDQSDKAPQFIQVIYF